MPEAVELLRTLNAVVIGALAAWFFAEWRKNRDEAKGWAALAFGVLGAVALIGQVLPEEAESSGLIWLRKANVVLILAFPYLLYRFASSFSRPPPIVGRLSAAIAGLLAAWTLALPRIPSGGEPRPGWFGPYVAAVLVYWTGLSLWVAARLWRAGRGQPSVARYRMRTLGLACMMLSLALVIAGAATERSGARDLFIQLLATASVALFAVAFHPPALVRTLWRRPQEEAMRRGQRALMVAAGAEEVHAHLLRHVTAILGARAAAIVDQQGKELARFEIVVDQPATEASTGQRTVPGSDAPSLSFPFSTGALVVWSSPYTPFFGVDEQALVASLTAMAELALERARTGERAAQLAAVVGSAQEAIIGKALDGTVLSWNSGAEKLYGYSADEMVGAHLAVIVPQELDGEIGRILERIRQGERVEAYETVRMRKDGSHVQVSLTVSPIIDAAGNVVGASTIAHDITARQRAEEVMRQQAAALKEQADLLDLTHDSVMMRDLDGTIRFWNQGAERNYGWTSEEVIGHSSHELLRTEFEDSLEEFMVTFLGDRRWEGELTHSTKDGRRVVVASRWSLRLNQEGQPDAVLEINNDVTERKEAEKALTAAKQAAEAASEAKSEFLANMSHEIRTPMNGVIGMASLLLETQLSEEQREYAETVRTSAEALLTVINDILDFSKVEAGKVDLEIIDFNLRRTVEEVAELLAERAQDKGVEIVAAIEPNVPTAVSGDPGRLRQVLVNLVSNAVKFTDSGEVVIRAQRVDEKDDGVLVRFEVSDTGIGIAPGHQGGLFASFAQADASTTRRYGGTGLGLAICKRLVELMSGDIAMQSEPGRGSTFWFTARLGQAAEELLEAGAGLEMLNGRSTLIVDDNATNMTILEQMVRSWGLRVASTDSGSSAMVMLREAAKRGDPYSFVLLDYHMPGMDGPAVARAITRDPSLAGVQIVLLSSSAERVQVRHEAEVRIAAHLTKPVRQSELYDCLATVVGKASTGRASVLAQVLAQPAPNRAPSRGGVRILMAEDNAVNQKVGARMLEKMGYSVDVVGNGAEAVRAVANGSYAAVFMDCQMPEMDGYQATAEIRRLEGSRGDTPIIALTASAMVGDRERCLAAGMDDYLSKPLRDADLATVLFRWLPGTDENAAALASPSARPAGVLDPEHLATLRDMTEYSGRDILAELAEIFARDNQTQLDMLERALEEEDAEALCRVAHTLKGTAGGLGATEAMTVCGRLESLARTGELEEAASLKAELETQFQRVGQALEEALSQEPHSP